MKYLFISLLFVTSIAQADDLVIHTVSWHARPSWEENYNTKVRYNDYNPGLGYRWNNGWNVGFYYNSFYKTSVYSAKEFMLSDNVGLIAGGVTGYKSSTGYSVAPLLGAEWCQPITDKLSAVMLVIPAFRNSPGVLHFAAEYSLP
jgi:hypothetical protein